MSASIKIIANYKEFKTFIIRDGESHKLGKKITLEIINLLKIYSYTELKNKFNYICVKDCSTQANPEEIFKLQKYSFTDKDNISNKNWYCLLYKCHNSLEEILKAGYVYNEVFDATNEYILNWDENLFTSICKSSKDKESPSKIYMTELTQLTQNWYLRMI